MSAAMHGPVVRKLGTLVNLTNEEITCLESLQTESRSFDRHATLYGEGDRIELTYMVVDGWAMRYKSLSDGRRQILNFILPGDFIGIYGSLIDTADHSVDALTRMQTHVFAPQRILEVFGKCPRLGAAIAWTAGREEAILAEQVVRIGRRSAFERTAHLFLELLRRLQLVGLAGQRSFEMPLSQDILADSLGLSLVHVNRTLRRLRQSGLVKLVDKRLIIEDVDRLERLAEFSPDYIEASTLPPATQAELR
ncbi:MAG TPA: Crp/Fnr family transcriptional regulator [Alphaproteobacteria bacterium]|jgi:CRP-like cAMP-binding protein|nr:Crp/Fnr family transcriptional regulator [Alphaproteobacteria bacterium]